MLRLWSSGAERARRSAELRIAALLLRMHLVLLSACCHVQFCCPFSVAQGATTLSLAAFCAKTRSLAEHIVAKVNFWSKHTYAQMSAVCLHFQFKCHLFVYFISALLNYLFWDQKHSFATELSQLALDKNSDKT